MSFLYNGLAQLGNHRLSGWALRDRLICTILDRRFIQMITDFSDTVIVKSSESRHRVSGGTEGSQVPERPRFGQSPACVIIHFILPEKFVSIWGIQPNKIKALILANYETIDLGYVKDLSGGDDVIVIELIELFLVNAPEAIDNIKKYYENEDWKKLGEEAHKIKPNMAYMGAEKARVLIEEIEKSAKDRSSPDDIGKKIERVESICDQAYAELNSVLEDLKQ